MEELMLRIQNPVSALALSDGKSLGANTVALFEEASMRISRPHPRDDLAKISGCPGFNIVGFPRADQVPWLVQQGFFAAGITGLDQVIESGTTVIRCADLLYSRVTNGGISCVVFGGPDCTCQTLEHLRGYARGRQGTPIKVATEYPKEVALFFKERGIDVEIIACSGKAELLVRIGVAEYGATITETGTSIEKNDCTILRDDNRNPLTVFESTTVLVANAEMYADPGTRIYIDALGRSLVGVLNARGKILLKMNAPVAKLEEIAFLLKKLNASLGEPTVSSHLGNDAMCSIESVAPAEYLNQICLELELLGVSGFIPFVPKMVR